MSTESVFLFTSQRAAGRAWFNKDDADTLGLFIAIFLGIATFSGGVVLLTDGKLLPGLFLIAGGSFCVAYVTSLYRWSVCKITLRDNLLSAKISGDTWTIDLTWVQRVRVRIIPTTGMAILRFVQGEEGERLRHKNLLIWQFPGVWRELDRFLDELRLRCEVIRP